MYEKLLLFLSQIISQIFKDRNQTLHIPNHKIDKRKALHREFERKGAVWVRLQTIHMNIQDKLD